jgi:hypothetical protein
MRRLHVAPVADQRWVVTLDEDGTTPVSEHRTRGEAETSARAYAISFGYLEVVVHHVDGEESVMILDDPDPQPPYPGGAKGAPAG